MTMVRGQYAQLMAPGIKHNFVEFLDLFQKEKEYDKVFNIENTTQAFEDEVQFAGTGPMPEKTEAEAVEYTQIIQGGTLRFIPLSYALGCRVSWELWNDDLYGIIKQAPKALARSARFTEEMIAWNVFNLGFTTLVTTDGVSLFNNEHPLLGGANATNTAPGISPLISASGTYPNRPAVDADLSYSAIILMSQQFEGMIDSLGLPVIARPQKLIIPFYLKFIARTLLGSPGKPGTGDNDINALLGEDLSWMVSHFLTSASAWYAVAAKENHQLKVKVREEIDADYDDDFDTRSMKMMSYMRRTAGATHWINTWGSNGP